MHQPTRKLLPISRPLQQEQGKCRGRLVDFLGQEDGAKSLKRPRQLEFSGQDSGRKEFLRDRTLGLQRIPLEHLAEYLLISLVVRKIPKARQRTTQKDQRSQCLASTHEWVQCLKVHGQWAEYHCLASVVCLISVGSCLSSGELLALLNIVVFFSA